MAAKSLPTHTHEQLRGHGGWDTAARDTDTTRRDATQKKWYTCSADQFFGRSELSICCRSSSSSESHSLRLSLKSEYSSGVPSVARRQYWSIRYIMLLTTGLACSAENFSGFGTRFCNGGKRLREVLTRRQNSTVPNGAGTVQKILGTV